MEKAADKLIEEGRVRKTPGHAATPIQPQACTGALKCSTAKPDWWWDGTWTPVERLQARVRRMQGLLVAAMAEESHMENRNSLHGCHRGGGRRKPRCGAGNLTALRDGDRLWTWPLTWPGIVNPALGPGKPNLIFAVVDGDLFAEVRPKVQRPKEVCRTLAASKHIGLLCSKYTRQMAAYFACIRPAHRTAMAIEALARL